MADPETEHDAAGGNSVKTDLYEAFAHSVCEDNVGGMCAFLANSGALDLNKVRPLYYMHEDISWSPVHLAAVYGAKHTVRRLLAHVERATVLCRCMPVAAIDEAFSCSAGFKVAALDEEDYSELSEADLNASQIATIFHGRDSECARLLRGDDALRRGFDALYFRAFRRAFAPGGAAAKRARTSFARDSEGAARA